MTEYKVIDNALSEKDFVPLEEFMMGGMCQWNYNDLITTFEDKEFPIAMFNHVFFCHNHEHQFCASNYYYLVKPVLNILNPLSIFRIKANMYLNQNKFVNHAWHRDHTDIHKGSIFSINDNNGYTVLEDGTKIESKRNRLLLFDSSKKHHSTNCTDAWRRVNINFNYF